MEIFRELRIRCGDEDRIQALMAEIGRNLPPGWSQSDGPGDFGENTGSASHLRNFRWDGGGRIPRCELVLLRMGPGSFGVGMVISQENIPRFTVSESNAAVVEFSEKVARPWVDRLGMDMELTRDQFDIRQWLSVAAAEKLRAFSRSANRRVGGALPEDNDRWLDFVVTAHRDGCILPATMLRRWLIEDEGWYFEVADRLAGEYAFGGEVLAYSERQTA